MKNKRLSKPITLLTLLVFFALLGTSLFLSGRYINKRLLESNVNNAVDIALLIKNNFKITDAEVTYMKGLTFNEMEVDSINARLMNVGKDVYLPAKINNIYLIAPLKDSEIKYTVTGKVAEDFGYKDGTELNGIWLLNGKIGDDGKFIAAKRDDIYRYTQLTKSQLDVIQTKKSSGEYSSDMWGEFITGYVPIYTVEGHFVGMLGIDMEPDGYQTNARHMILIMFIIFGAVAALVIIFLLFYFRYTEVKNNQLAFDFYSQMSHDMRTPMNAILGLSDLSESENDPKVLKEYMGKIHQSGHYLLGLINDTLDYQKIVGEQFKLSPEVILASDVLDGIFDIIRLSAEEKGVDFSITNKGTNLNEYLNVDAMRVRQIFMNLLSNAVKFTAAGGKVELIIERISTENNVAHDKITICDNGIGMSSDFLKDGIFKPFSQEHNDITKNATGTGLGLSIVKKLVDLMGASITVDSKQGVGTVFTVCIDFMLTDTPSQPNQPKPTAKSVQPMLDNPTIIHSADNYKILLAEDQPLNAEISKKMLEKQGYEVIWAKNGKMCVDMFEKSALGDFDAILMDIRMPIMDGLTATRTIRGLDRADAVAVPIIAMSANTFVEDIQISLDAGMNAHLAKPVEPQNLYETLAKLIEKSKHDISSTNR